MTLGVSSDGSRKFTHFGVLAQGGKESHRVDRVVLVLHLRVKNALDQLKLFFRNVNLVGRAYLWKLFETTFFFSFKERFEFVFRVVSLFVLVFSLGGIS